MRKLLVATAVAAAALATVGAADGQARWIPPQKASSSVKFVPIDPVGKFENKFELLLQAKHAYLAGPAFQEVIDRSGKFADYWRDIGPSGQCVLGMRINVDAKGMITRAVIGNVTPLNYDWRSGKPWFVRLPVEDLVSYTPATAGRLIEQCLQMP